MKVLAISVIATLVITLNYAPAYAQVYTEQVDMLCPDFLLGSWFDFGETRDWIHICPINEPSGGGGAPVPDPPQECSTQDSDGDVIDDCTDQCPLEPETVNFFQDGDGCPDEAPEEPIIPILGNILFQVFGNTITTEPDRVVTGLNLLAQWSSPEDITIETVRDTPSPFIFTFETTPVIKKGSGLPISQGNIGYSVVIPNQCGSVVNNECVELVRYEVPVRVTANVNGTALADDTNIVIDLSDEPFDPVLLLLWLLLLIPILGILARRRKKKKIARQSVRSQLRS